MGVIREQSWNRKPPISAQPSIFDGEALPDFVDPLVERVEPRVHRPVVKIEYVSRGESPENPVVSFHVGQHLLNQVTDGNNNVPQNVHRTPRFPHFF